MCFVMKCMRWNGGNYYDRKRYDQTDIIRRADGRITPFIIFIKWMWKYEKSAGRQESAVTECRSREEKINFSEKKYQERIVDNRIAIAEYPNHYEQEIQEIQNLSYPNIHFTEDCTVDPFPEELSRLSVFHTTEHGMSVQEGVETLENWLVSIGKRDDIKYRKKSGVECLCRYDFGDGILYEKYLRAQVFPIWGSYLYLAGSCVGLMIGCMFAAKKYQAGR